MTIRKNLTNIVLAGALALGVAGCGNNPEYHFNGKIGEKQVKFYEKIAGGINILEVVEADRSKSKYIDSNNDFKLDCVEITVGDNITEYYAASENPVVLEILEKAQKEFDAYLTKITDIQTAPLNRK
ncbi:MAG: hypothetical protein Q8O84_05085 [Nanoarchaeota archaeon]|nr:hypothetical protein [Nanoarchaeota archaeon]